MKAMDWVSKPSRSAMAKQTRTTPHRFGFIGESSITVCTRIGVGGMTEPFAKQKPGKSPTEVVVPQVRRRPRLPSVRHLRQPDYHRRPHRSLHTEQICGFWRLMRTYDPYAGSKEESMPRTGEPIGEHLSSLDAGLQVMTMFIDADSINVTSVARELSCSRSTSYRILNTLRNRGIVILGPTGRGYFPGPVLLDLARPRGLDLDDRHRLRPIIGRAALTGETVHVATLIGTQILFFDGEEPDRPVRATLRQDMRPAHAISAGKLLLSQLTDDQVRALYPTQHLPKLTPRTIDNVSALLDELDTIRRTGHAFSKQEVETGLCGTPSPCEAAHGANASLSTPQCPSTAETRKDSSPSTPGCRKQPTFSNESSLKHVDLQHVWQCSHVSPGPAFDDIRRWPWSEAGR
ncbi:hypothetical protein EEB14_01980 [Rhodococcus sp. WS4]|nr:hypothetical protein EEB14_01980 [Rhodococcus sp. WS4]